MNVEEPHILYSTTSLSCALANPSEPLGPIFKSTDGAITWGELPGTENLKTLFSYAFNSDIVIATDCTAFFVSTDGGQSWTRRPEPDTDSAWNIQTLDTAIPLYGIDETDESISGVELIYASGSTEAGQAVVLYTKDLGRTWTPVTPDVYPVPIGPSDLKVDRLNPGQIWLLDTQGLWVSDDGGLAWAFTNNGLAELINQINSEEVDDAWVLNTLLTHPSGQLYLGTDQGMYTKSTQGTRWLKIMGTSFDSNPVLELLFVETKPELLYVSTDNGVHLVRLVE